MWSYMEDVIIVMYDVASDLNVMFFSSSMFLNSVKPGIHDQDFGMHI